MNTATISTVTRRIQAQGFCDYDEKTYQQLNYPLRLSPAICMTWAAVGTALASATIVWSLVPFAILGATLRGHPFDVIYNHGLRYVFDTPRIPQYPVRRRIACLMASVMLIAAAWCFQSGMLFAGAVFGWTMVLAAFVNVSTGFCIPSFICRLVAGELVCDLKST